jgi:hypothetical protein
MAVMVYLCAWQGMRDAPGYRADIHEEFRWQRSLKSALEDYHKQHQNYPEKLADLKAVRPDEVRTGANGEVVDNWGHSYLYLSEGNSYTLISFGRDGKRGGEGLDQDIDARGVRSNTEDFFEFPSVGIPTLRQFAFECGTGGVTSASALAGICAFVATFIALEPDRRAIRLIGLVLTLGACLVTGFLMCVFHLPHHH